MPTTIMLLLLPSILHVHTTRNLCPPTSPCSYIVYRARCTYSGGIVVLKGYARETLTLQTRQRIWSEVTMLQNAHCPFILKCFDAFEDQVCV